MSRFLRRLSGVVSILFLVPFSHSLEDWEKDYRNLIGSLEVTARDGVSILSGPGSGSNEIERIGGAFTFTAHGFIEVEGIRYYVQESDHEKWIDERKKPVWIRIHGAAEFPPVPPMIFEGKGSDPMSGDDVDVEVYEETVAIGPESVWPIPVPEYPDVMLPVKVVSSESRDDGTWEATFTVYPNFDSQNVWQLGFADASYNQYSDPNYRHVMRRLISKPARQNFLVRGSVAGDRIVGTFQPGMVFHGSFSGGKLVRLRAGDNWPPVVACSNLSPPLFQAGDELRFRFAVNTLDGGHTEIQVRPDKVSGADYTKYDIISQFGPPFDDEQGRPEWGMDEWALVVRSDGEIHVEAPLWDGRGAAGMLELEGLGLEPSYEEEIKLLKGFIGQRPPRLPEAAGWDSILKKQLGSVPLSQRIEETEETGFE